MSHRDDFRSWGLGIDKTDDWRDRAECRKYHPEIWFGPGNSFAVAVCNDCPVSRQCLKFAIDNQIIDGIWGGKTEPELRKMVGRRSEKGFGRGIVQARRRYCPQGHEYTPDNTIINPRNARVCRACTNAARAARRRRAVAA